MSVPQTNLGSLLDPVTKRNQEYNIQFIIVKSILKYTVNEISWFRLFLIGHNVQKWIQTVL